MQWYTVGRQNDTPEYVHLQIPRTCEYSELLTEEPRLQTGLKLLSS